MDRLKQDLSSSAVAASFVTVWSSPGAALLVSMLAVVSLAQALSAYGLASSITAMAGLSRACTTLVAVHLKAIATGISIGLLFRIGTDLFAPTTPYPYWYIQF